MEVKVKGVCLSPISAGRTQLNGVMVLPYAKRCSTAKKLYKAENSPSA